MEKYSRRESILLGLSPQISLPASSSPKSVDRHSDIDFNDVFGGPPRRRSSISDRRYSFNESADSRGDEPVVTRNLWTGLSEKPVFGQETGYGRQHSGHGFFDDIFKGEDYCVSSPRKHDREPFSPLSSRISSPIMPFPPMAETFGSPSPPARFSLPARVLRGIDFSSFNRSSKKCNDSATDGVNPSHSPSLSRFSSLSSQAQDDIKHDIQTFYRTSLSSQELNHSRDRDRDDRSETTNTGDSLEKQSLNGAEDSTNGSQLQFHFSIYKWANKEVPLTMPPTRMNLSKSKKSPKIKKSSSSYEGKTDEKKAGESPTSTLRSNFDHPSNNPIFTSGDSFKLRHGKEENEFGYEEKDQQTKEPTKIVEEPCLPRPESLSLIMSSEDDAKRTAKGAYIKDGGAEAEAKSKSSVSLTVEHGNNLKRNNGKVKDFVMIFNQDHSSTSVGDPESQSHRQKKKGTSGTGIEVGDSTRIEEKLSPKKVNETVGNVKNMVSNVTIDADELSKQPSTEQTVDKTDSNGINTTFYEQNSPSISPESIPEDSKFTVIDIDLAFQEDFLIQELPQDEIKQSQMQNDREEQQAINVKIRQWSRGKEGNIRSLLSTLQYVLWPESGWRPVPLVDIIDGNAVKRSYQRALLCLHPDKLQQRGVTSQQKYTAEKVFDILQEAWTLFSSVAL